MTRKELVDTLELVKLALLDNNSIPQFQCFMFNGDGTVTATNDQIAIVGPCGVKDSFAVDGKTLLGLLQNSRAKEVNFTVEPQDIHIKASRSTFKLPYHPKADFLFVMPTTKPESDLVNLDTGVLEGLLACLHTASKDNTQPALMGICLHKRATLYSCDGDAISRYKLKAKATNAPDRLLPNSFCEALISICKATNTAKGTLVVDDEWAKVAVGGYTVFGRVMHVDKPLDYEALIKSTLKNDLPDFIAVPRQLDDALSRARVLADPESAKTVIEISDGKFRLLTETHMGVVRDSIATEHSDTVANVNAAMMQRAIGLCDEMAVCNRCTVYRNGDTLFQLLSNMS